MKYLQTVVIGCVLVLAVSLIPHISESLKASIFGVFILILVLWLAKKVADHFCFEHTHEGDSQVDKSIGATLFTVNILHPLVDGFALYATYISHNNYLFISILVGIVIHEIFRQSALVIIFRQFGFAAWKVILPAFGGMAFGWLLGNVGGSLPSGLEPYIDAITFGAYIFIVAEYLFAHKEIFKSKKALYWLLFGVLVASIFITFFKAH